MLTSWADPFGRNDDLERRVVGLGLDTAEGEGDADGHLAAGGVLARLGTGVGIVGDVLVKGVHIGPAFVLAHHLQPARDVEKAGARGIRIGHGDVTGVVGFGQIGPGGRHRQAIGLEFDGVDTDRRDPGIHTGPGGRLVRIDEFRVEFLDTGRRVGLEHALVLQEHQGGGGQPPDDVRLRIVLLRQQLCGHDARGVPDPFDGDIGIVLVEALGVFLQILGFDRGVDGQFGRGGCLRGDQGQESARTRQKRFRCHGVLSFFCWMAHWRAIWRNAATVRRLLPVSHRKIPRIACVHRRPRQTDDRRSPFLVVGRPRSKPDRRPAAMGPPSGKEPNSLFPSPNAIIAGEQICKPGVSCQNTEYFLVFDSGYAALKC